MNYLDEIKSNQVVLLVNKESNLEFIRELSRKFKIGYIVTSRAAEDVLAQLIKAKANTKNIIFVDTFTAQKKVPPVISDVVFASSPGALAEIRVAFSSFINERHCSYMVFDCITDILPFNNLSENLKFIQMLIYEAKVNGKNLVFIENSRDNRLHDDLKMFADKCIEIK